MVVIVQCKKFSLLGIIIDIPECTYTSRKLDAYSLALTKRYHEKYITTCTVIAAQSVTYLFKATEKVTLSNRAENTTLSRKNRFIRSR